MIRVLVTGAGGFVGQSVVEELARRGYEARALVHHRPAAQGDKIVSVPGDLFDLPSLDRAIEGCQAVIHLVGIIMENPSRGVTFERIHVQGTRNILEAAQRHRATRFIHMSALGTRRNAPSTYHQTKYRAEELVKASGLDWTILRPSMIHGPRGDFMKMEAAWARKKAPPYLFMPFFGAGLLGQSGAGRLQPVFVEDVARAFVDCLERPQTVGKIYELAGAQQLTWPELHRLSAQAIVGHARWVLPLPVWKATMLTYLVPRFLLPFNRDQIVMSQEDNTADMTPFTRDFGWAPGAFSDQFPRYAHQL